MNKEVERNPQISHLEEGDVIELKKGHTIYANIPEKYVYKDTKKPDKQRKAEISIGEDYGGLDTSYLGGRYAVVKTTLVSNETGMELQDVIQNDHHVWCKKMFENGELGEQIEFYLNGAFSAMDQGVKPIGKLNSDALREETSKI